MTATLIEPRDVQLFDKIASLCEWEDEPMGFEAGDANLYRYVGNSPTNYIDPYGLDAGGRMPIPPVPEPPGGPPIGIPGGPWKRIDPVGPGRRPKWVPINPPKGQSPPDASWDPGPPGHWDVNDGCGKRQRYDEDGNPITTGQAHGAPAVKVTPSRPWYYWVTPRQTDQWHGILGPFGPPFTLPILDPIGGTIPIGPPIPGPVLLPAP
jgi:hypothetical protein